MPHRFEIVLIIVLTLLLSACGGGGGGGAPEPSPAAQTGNMTVTIAGLAANQDADVQITGPDSYSQTVTRNTTLTGLATGEYQLTAGIVSSNSVSFSANPQSQSATVAANQTTAVAISYAAPMTSVGVITGFGSVFVNGTRFDTDTAQIKTDDSEDAPESDLEVGMIVTVEGTVGADGIEGDAATIEYQAKAEGPVDAIDLAAGSLTVLGQVFFIDELTQFENTRFEALLIGDVVEISAFGNASGELVASRIEKEDTALIEYKLRGEVSNLKETERTFDIEQLSIDYSVAELQGVLANGVTVKVESSSALVAGLLIADSVAVKDERIATGQQLAIDGVIVSFTSIAQFTVNERTVTTHENTDFKGGDEGELAIGSRVKVFGSLNDDGVLVARTVRIDKQGVVKLEGNIEAVDAFASTFTLLGITIRADTHTQFIDESEAGMRRFDLLHFQIGDEVEVKAFEQASGLIARKVKRSKTTTEGSEDSDDTAKVEGPVDHIQENGFSIRGVTVHTSKVTEFEGAHDAALTSAEFYALIKEGDVVQVEGVTQEDSSILALAVELEERAATKHVKFDGLIDRFESSSNFSVNEHAITTDFKTRYQHGGPDDLAVGVHVEIKGAQGDSGVILARHIKFDREGARDVELEGAIDTFISVTDFNVEGQAVTTDDDTEFEHGSEQDLALEVFVEIKGMLTNDGVVLASKIEFKEAEELSHSGPIENFVSATEFMVAGQAVATDDHTEYEHGSVSMLANRVFIHVDGVLNAANVLLASEIEFQEAEEKSLQGVIEDFTSATDFVVDLQTITTDEFTEFKHGTAEDLALGVSVEVEGFLNYEQVLIASKVEFKEEDGG